MASRSDNRYGSAWPDTRWPAPYKRRGPKYHVRAAPLECGHEFRSDIPPQPGERVWCWTCDGYCRVGKQDHRPARAGRNQHSKENQDGSSY